MSAAHVASMGSRVNERTVRRFVKEWLANEGFFHPMNWGANRKAPYFLDDEVISSKSSRWLRVNTGFKKGMLIISDSAHLLISSFVVCEMGITPQAWPNSSSSYVATNQGIFPDALPKHSPPSTRMRCALTHVGGMRTTLGITLPRHRKAHSRISMSRKTM